MSAIKNLVAEYASLVFPVDPRSADRLEEAIYDGSIPMSIDALIAEVSRLRHRESGYGTSAATRSDTGLDA